MEEERGLPEFRCRGRVTDDGACSGGACSGWWRGDPVHHEPHGGARTRGQHQSSRPTARPPWHDSSHRRSSARCCCGCGCGCWLLAAGCWLLAAGCCCCCCWLLAAGCWWLAAGCWLSDHHSIRRFAGSGSPFAFEGDDDCRPNSKPATKPITTVNGVRLVDGEDLVGGAPPPSPQPRLACCRSRSVTGKGRKVAVVDGNGDGENERRAAPLPLPSTAVPRGRGPTLRAPSPPPPCLCSWSHCCRKRKWRRRPNQPERKWIPTSR
jgi:hypothetical protein